MSALIVLEDVSVGVQEGAERIADDTRSVTAQECHVVEEPDRALVRFDGVRFVAFSSLTVDAFSDNFVQSLLVDSAGTLWIGTDGWISMN